METCWAYELQFQCCRCCNVVVSVSSSVRAPTSLLRSSPARGPVELERRFLTRLSPPAQLCDPLAPHHHPDKGGSPGKTIPWITSSCNSPWLTLAPSLSSAGGSQTSLHTAEENRGEQQYHHLEAPFLYIHCLLASSTTAWYVKSCFPQSSKTLLCMCRSEF